MIFKFVSLREDFQAVERETFRGAFVDMFNWVHQRFEDGSMSFLELETAIWIEAGGQPIYFFAARDLACDMGILKDGKLI